MATPSRAQGELDLNGDVDRFVLDLVQGQRYLFELLASAGRDQDNVTLTLSLNDAQDSTLRTSTILLAPDIGDSVAFAFTAPRSGPFQLVVAGSNYLRPINYAVQAVTVAADDHADRHRDATLLTLGGTTRGSFDLPGDADSFAVDLAQGQHVVFDVVGVQTSGSAALPFRARLFDTQDQQLSPVASAGGNKLQLGFTAAQAGRYVIELRASGTVGEPGAPALGSYDISAKSLPADDHADQPAAATVIALTGSTPVRLDHAGDIDWFRLNLTAGEHYSFALLGAGGALPTNGFVLAMFNANAEVLHASSGTGLIFEPQTSGTYYLRAANPGLAPYSALVPANYVLSAGVLAVPDVGGATWNAAALPLGQTIAGTFVGPGDDDVGRFEAVAGQRYRFELLGDSTFLGTPSLRFSAGVAMAPDTEDITPPQLDFDPTGRRPQIYTYQAQQTGTVYVELSSPQDRPLSPASVYRYQLTGNVVGPDDHGNTRVLATPLAQNAQAQAQLEPGDADVFRIELLGGQRYVFESVGARPPSEGSVVFALDLYAASGQFPIASAVSPSAWAFVAPASGSYYLSTTGTGGNLALSFRAIAPDDFGDIAGSAARGVPAAQFDNTGLTLTGSSAADHLAGSHRADRLFGQGGDDDLRGGRADDVLDGGAGIDTAHFDGVHSAYALRATDTGWTVLAQLGLEGTDTLSQVERLAFDGDTLRTALDIGGRAGDVAKVLGALFGKASLAEAALVGIGLKFLDGGASYGDLLALAVASNEFALAAGLDLPHFRGRFRFRPCSVDMTQVQGYPRGLPVDSSLHQPVHRAGCPQVRSTRWVTRLRAMS